MNYSKRFLSNLIFYSSRRALTVEMDMEKPENVQIIQKRQEAIEKKEEIQKTVQEMLDPFYCKLCSKGYKRIDQYNEHLSSYDHNHRQVSVVTDPTKPSDANLLLCNGSNFLT